MWTCTLVVSALLAPPPPIPPAESVASVLELTPEAFRRDAGAQRDLLEMARRVRDRQQAMAERIRERGRIRGCKVRSLLKRPSNPALAAAVLEKCARNHYERIGQMDDIVRGRFDLKDAAEVTLVAAALQNQTEYPLRNAVGPRRPLEAGGHGYPRWHVTLRDPETGLSHEWQVGTRAVTEVFEREGIRLPRGLSLGPGMRPNLHDIDYEVFQSIRRSLPEVHERAGLASFEARVERLAADAGLQGEATPRLRERIDELQRLASARLQALVDEFGPRWLETFYR